MTKKYLKTSLIKPIKNGSKTSDSHRDMKELMKRCISELKSPVYSRYRGLREIRRKIASTIPDGLISNSFY